MNKKSRSKTPLKPRAHFKGGFVEIIPQTSLKLLTIEKTFSNYILIVDTYSKIPIIYGMERITTEEMMDSLDLFQDRFGKVDEF